MTWIKNLFSSVRKAKFSITLNRCNVSRVRTDEGINVISRPGKTFDVEIEMNESDVLTNTKLGKELLDKCGVDLYYNDVLKITNLRTGEVIKEKNIREYYMGVPEDEFIKLGF